MNVQPVHPMGNGIFRGPRPESYEDWLKLDTLQPNRIRTILNLEGGFIEAMTRDGNRQQIGSVYSGMETIRIEMNALMPPNREDVAWALYVMRQEKFKPIYVHCRQGVDRTGFVVAAYRMTVQDWSYEHAVTEMIDQGFHRWYFYWLPALRSWSQRKFK